jgi:NADPH:quinone reductase-like Zn-dependent oxidoreductase
LAKLLGAQVGTTTSTGNVELVRSLGADEVIDDSFLFARPDGDQLAQIGKLLETQRIRPVIDKVFAFEQAGEALAYLALGRAKGKVVVQMR